MQTWEQAQEWERKWHGDCINSYWEETKQIVYAKKMGLKLDMVEGKYPVIHLEGKSILDIGGGPYSLLLKSVHFSEGFVVDPCEYPEWVERRYETAGVQLLQIPAEQLEGLGEFDEVWIYNCLQHTRDPEKIIKNAKEHARIIRIFEWIDIPVSDGHIHELKEKELNSWLGGNGKVENLNESGCYGRAYYGIFKGDYFLENNNE